MVTYGYKKAVSLAFIHFYPSIQKSQNPYISTFSANIDGILADGTAEPVFRNGDWAF
ncbi:hypothetical protein BAOM_1385 [Peribacillus asahii]|uniref:Uncharacterized protein n=1 Tax=Peribacillus asahii TaxID=228899 RepID=A0A3Q9RLK7_9BACI|nr:hypothetical protein [Peribacillus asahii]AZV41995.1 hypothetical protein BAOM_1385 [Peribacillus asahii]